MRRTGKFQMLLLASLCWLAAVASAWAQESRATLGGRVTDPQGGVIAGATVTVISDDTGVKQGTTTNEQGEWKVPFLNPGHYSLTVAFSGFKTAERKGITLSTADDKQVDISLEVGTTSQQVQVTAEAPLIDTTSATSGTVITPEVMSEMPLLSRIPTLLAGLSPGVLLQDQNQNVPRMWSVIAASDIRVDGGRDDRSNEFLLDGTPDVQGSRIAFIPPLDSVQEFKVMTNAYDAQYGRQAGATINMSVKSGGKDYHGSLYEFIQNDALNAALFQSNLSGEKKPPAHYNLYGGTLGGPVRIPKVYNGKDRTFFFFNFEGTRNEDPRFTLRSVPTMFERNGDFSQSFTSHLVASNKYPPGPDTRVIDKIHIYNPYQVNSSTKVRTEFPNDVIPQKMISPIANAILQYVPPPNRPNDPTGSDTNNFVPRSTRRNQMASTVARADHTWNNQHKSFLNLRWNHETEHLDNYFDNVSTGAGPNQRINYGLGLDHDWVISPTKVLDIRYGLTRWEEPTLDNGTGFDPTSLGFSPSLVAQMRPTSFPRVVGLFGDIGTGNAGSYFKTLYHDWNASLTHVHGNMSLHYGGEFRVMQEASGGLGAQGGQFNFDNVNWTKRVYDETNPASGNGSRLASFLLGLPNGGNFPRNTTRFDSQRYYAFFFQNDWRVTPRLTLNLGLRWDYEQPFAERHNRIADDVDPRVLNPISDSAQAAYAKIMAGVQPDPNLFDGNNKANMLSLVPVDKFKVYGAQLFNGLNGHRRNATNNDLNEWQPRVGFAYRLKPHTVIRGGFGRFVQGAGIKGGQNGYNENNPFVASDNSFRTPFDTLANPFQLGILDPPGPVDGPLTNLGQTLDWDNQNPGHPHSWEYSFHIQHEHKGWLFEVGYSHNKTYGIYWGLDQNLPSFDLWKQLRTVRWDQGYLKSHPGCLQQNSCKPNDTFLADQDVPNPFYQLPGVARGLFTSQNRHVYDLVRPMPEFGGATKNDNPWGTNQYDAMLVKVEHRFSKGLNLLSAFTWSKLFEDTSFWGPEISGPITEHKLGGEDRPYRFSVAPIYEVPVGRAKKFGSGMPRVLDAFVGGWELTGQLTLQSGTPLVFGTDSFYDGKDFHLPRDQRTLDRWFDTSHFVKFPDKNTDISGYPAWTGVFSLPGANYQSTGPSDIQNGVYKDFGTFVRRYPTRWADARASRVNEVNLGLFKNFKPTERTKLQFRLEAFNAFNHPRFGAPDTNPGSSNFGRVQPAQLNTARLIQAALKLYF